MYLVAGTIYRDVAAYLAVRYKLAALAAFVLSSYHN
jgi:hypothetical protein